MSKAMACAQIADLDNLASWVSPGTGTRYVRGTYAYIYAGIYAARLSRWVVGLVYTFRGRE